MTLTVIPTVLAVAIFHLVSGSNVTNSTEQISVAVQLTFTDYSDQDVIPALNITASKGTTAFEFLSLAAQLNPCYSFQYEGSTSLGHNITSICCVAENKTTNFYWFVYINNNISTVGVDLLKPNNGDTLRFEYRLKGQPDPKEKISVWVELIFTNYPNPNVVPPQQVIAPNGTAAFEILQLAGDVNPCFKFQYETFSIGRNITTICCVEENSTTNFFWFADINGKRSRVGVDLLMPLIPKNGETMKFEYRMRNFNITNHTTTPSVSTKQTPSNTTLTSSKTTHKGKAHQMCAQNLNIYLWLAVGILGWNGYKVI